jgi:hypothetical protein
MVADVMGRGGTPKRLKALAVDRPAYCWDGSKLRVEQCAIRDKAQCDEMIRFLQAMRDFLPDEKAPDTKPAIGEVSV